MNRAALIGATISAALLCTCHRKPPEPAKPAAVASGPSATDLAEIAWGQGNEAAAADDFWGAIAYYDKAIGIAPQLADLYVARGSAHVAVQNYDRAFDDYLAAVERDPELASAYYARGSLYWLLGQLPQAERDYATLVRLRPDDAFYAQRYTRTLWDEGKHQEVEDFYRRVLDGHPERDWAAGSLLYTVEDNRGRAAAIEEAKALYDSGNRTIDIMTFLGTAYFKDQNYAAAEGWLGPLLDRDANEVSPDAVNTLAEARARTDDVAGCVAARKAYLEREGRPASFVEANETAQCQNWQSQAMMAQGEAAQ